MDLTPDGIREALREEPRVREQHLVSMNFQLPAQDRADFQDYCAWHHMTARKVLLMAVRAILAADPRAQRYAGAPPQ